MPWTELIEVLSYAILALGGWILKSLWAAVHELRTDIHLITKDISLLRENIAKDYIPRDEIRDLFDNILSEIRSIRTEIRDHEIREDAWHQKISDSLSHKVDK